MRLLVPLKVADFGDHVISLERPDQFPFDQTNLQYKFKYKDGRFQLIGAEFDETHRATMENTKRSFNFLLGKFKETKTFYNTDENGEQIEKTSTKWERISPRIIKSLNDIPGPLQWEVCSGVRI